MANEFFYQLSEKYPFITVCLYGNIEYLGIIQNQDSTVTTMYDFGKIINLEEKQIFLEKANIWWWESNRSIPINIFLREDWAIFKPYLQTFINKDLHILYGPCTSLSDLTRKRTKKQSITLVRRFD